MEIIILAVFVGIVFLQVLIGILLITMDAIQLLIRDLNPFDIYLFNRLQERDNLMTGNNKTDVNISFAVKRAGNRIFISPFFEKLFLKGKGAVSYSINSLNKKSWEIAYYNNRMAIKEAGSTLLEKGNQCIIEIYREFDAFALGHLRSFVKTLLIFLGQILLLSLIILLQRAMNLPLHEANVMGWYVFVNGAILFYLMIVGSRLANLLFDKSIRLLILSAFFKDVEIDYYEIVDN